MEDMYDTSLSLGLGYHGTSQGNSSCKPEPWVSSPSVLVEPALTLGLPGIALQSAWMNKADVKASAEFSLIAQSSSHSTASASSKRGSEEPERVSSRASDDEEDGSPRKKLRLTKQQSALLEERFKEHSTLNPKQKQALAKQLNLRPRQVEVWFQNRRARTKTKQTEIDREFLRRCCESLRDENRKLRKELRELKAIKVASPWYTQFSRDTMVVCPSCDKVTGSGGDYSKISGTRVAVTTPKPQLLNPFARYTAC